ncbi:MAG: TlpA family protein disulfide reductase [Dactylosporangium sp.]|nr:TlpA family protein disulfide reductase [Dactylosporangium sp.]
MSAERRARRPAPAGDAVRSGPAVRPASTLRRTRRRPAGPAAAVVGALAGLLVLAGCGSAAAPSPTPEPSPTSPFAPCPSPISASLEPATGPLAGITLPCFTGGEPVQLDRLGRPAVINLWASWCPPCRDELPELQAFADEMGDHVLVLGVVTDDRWSAAAWAGIYFGARYPNLFDPDKTLLNALGRSALPVTLIVGADGSIAATDVSGSLTVPELRALVSENLGLD